jgi:hypothetical protein
MRTIAPATELEVRAVEALKAVLGEVSVIKLREIRRQSPRRGHATDLVARVDVFGHSLMLACDVKPYAHPRYLRASLRQLQEESLRHPGTTPILIAPSLSPEAREMCKENKAGFIDLEGNARLSLGDVFIVKSSVPRTASQLPAQCAEQTEQAIAPGSIHNVASEPMQPAMMA